MSVPTPLPSTTPTLTSRRRRLTAPSRLVLLNPTKQPTRFVCYVAPDKPPKAFEAATRTTKLGTTGVIVGKLPGLEQVKEDVERVHGKGSVGEKDTREQERRARSGSV